MNYIGIDIHKKHCVLSALNEAGERTREGRIGTNDRAGFAEYLRAVGGPCRAVIEACWGWGIGCDGYFGALYRRAREQDGHGANTAIIIVARRMAEIAWQMLGQKRKYENRPPKAASPQRVKTKAAKPIQQTDDTKTFPARSRISLAAS